MGENGRFMGEHADADGRLEAFGNQLLEVHRWLRAELADLRESVSAASEAGERLRDLRTHCLAFCSALGRHHTGEDASAFPVLAERVPELAPALEKLREDHTMVDVLLDQLRELADSLGPDDAARVRWVQGEVDGLSAIVESHFRFEEREIISALNALDVPEWRDAPPAFLLTGRPSP